jgi:hypothetical protein
MSHRAVNYNAIQFNNLFAIKWAPLRVFDMTKLEIIFKINVPFDVGLIQNLCAKFLIVLQLISGYKS